KSREWPEPGLFTHCNLHKINPRTKRVSTPCRSRSLPGLRLFGPGFPFRVPSLSLGSTLIINRFLNQNLLIMEMTNLNDTPEFTDFTGTSAYYRYLAGSLLTDGIKHLGDEYQCYWFLDQVAGLRHN